MNYLLDTPDKYLIFSGQKLYSKDGLGYYKVPVAYGTRLIEGSVAATCENLKMKAVCWGAAGCSFVSSRCMVSPINTDCTNSMTVLSKLICNGNYPGPKCPQMEGMFNDMKAFSGGYECGNVKGVYCARGKQFVSSKETPYYAYCIV